MLIDTSFVLIELTVNALIWMVCMYVCNTVHNMLGGWWKTYESVCFVLIKVVNVWHFHSTQHVSWSSVHVVLLVHESIWLPHNSSISGFDNVFTFVYIIIIHPCTIRNVLYLFLPTVLWIVSIPMFTMCILTVISFVGNSLVWIWMWIFSNVVWNGLKWICFCVFPSLVPHVMFHCYGCWLDVLSVACNYSP